jgi:hypothetical protein
MQICTVPTVLPARRHLEAPSMPRVPINRTPSHLADMSDPWPRPIQTDRHGQPPIGVSSCPVGEIGRWGEACSPLPLLRIPKLTRQCKRATRKPPPVCLRYDQKLQSKLSAKFELLLLPTRSMTSRMFAELSPSSEVLLSPISAPAPQSWVVATALVRWQIKRALRRMCSRARIIVCQLRNKLSEKYNRTWQPIFH